MNHRGGGGAGGLVVRGSQQVGVLTYFAMLVKAKNAKNATLPFTSTAASANSGSDLHIDIQCETRLMLTLTLTQQNQRRWTDREKQALH